MASVEPTVRRNPTFGNFRRPISPGLGGLGLLGTGLMLVSIIGLVVLLMFGLYLLAIPFVLLVVVLLAAVAIRDVHGRSVAMRIANRVGWARTRRSGSHLYRSGTIGRTGWGTCQLPGLLAQSRLHEAHDSYGRPFAIVEHPAVAHYSVVISCEPDGSALVDQEQIDAWVANWGAWLAALGQEAGLVAAAVTVETAPDTGTRLRREVLGRLDPDAPALAQGMLREVMATYPTGSAQVRAWVSLVFQGRSLTGKRRDVEEISRDIGSRIPMLTQALSATGAGAARPLDAQGLCEVVRVAYDPAAAAIIDDIHAEGGTPELTWDGVGPAGAQASWDLYRHDSAFSRTWMMTSAPRGEVFSNVLARLLAPHPDVDRKRVTIIYRPLDQAAAARTVEQDKRVADFNMTTSPRPSARAVAAARAAAATANEEAKGAGLLDFGMLITASVADYDRVADARAAIESLASTARLIIRPVTGAQDSAFAACLPVGMVLQSHLRVPAEIRNSL